MGKFMAKVYADKKLNYGKLKEFEKPATMNNEELSADADWGRIFRQGDSTSVDEGNGDAGDFMDAPMMEETPAENIPIESDISTKAAADTGKKENKPEAGKQNAPAALKPADDKTKKPAKTEPAKSSPTKNDY